MIRTRAELKGFFKKNQIPTQANFEDLIDSALSLNDDGIAKLPNDPLTIQATGPQETLLRFSRVDAGGKPAPTWLIAQQPAGATTAGLAFQEVAGSAVRLFVQGGTGNVGIGTSAPVAKLEVNGAAVVSNGSSYATKNNSMAAGSLTVGGTDTSYGGGNGWNTNTAGLLLETKANTEIAVHDSETRIASLMYYEGDAANRITIGRDMGWGTIGQVVVNGNVGIGTASPGVKLDVVGYTSITMDSPEHPDWLDCGSGVNHQESAITRNVSIRTSEWIASRWGLVAYSDRRIKRDVQASRTEQDLATVLQLRVADYRMKDPAEGGNGWRKGFIAQEVEKVIPGAVVRSVEFVPDIFSLSTAAVFDPATNTLSVSLAKDHGLTAGDRVRLHVDGSRLDATVCAASSAREFVVEHCESAPQKVFVYGRQVSDFLTLDYDRIFTTSVGAIQELARKVDALEADRTEVKALCKENTALRARIGVLEARDKAGFATVLEPRLV